MNTKMNWKDLKFWSSPTWDSIKKLTNSLEKRGALVPARRLMLRPIFTVPLNQVKVMMVFPEPYANRRAADGLSLVSLNPYPEYSLSTTPLFMYEFYQELRIDQKVQLPSKVPDLKKWVNQGILFWHGRLTTTDRVRNAHVGLGWQELTREVIETLYLIDPKTVFVFFGDSWMYQEFLPSDAKMLAVPMPDPTKPEKFRGCELFSRVNDELKSVKRNKINWSL